MTRLIAHFRARASAQDDAHDDESDDGNGFYGGKDVLGFAVAFDSKEVDGDDEGEEDNDPGVGVDPAVVPVGDCEGGGDDFDRERDEPLEGVAV